MRMPKIGEEVDPSLFEDNSRMPAIGQEVDESLFEQKQKPEPFHPKEELIKILKNLPNIGASFIAGQVEPMIQAPQEMAKLLNPYGKYLDTVQPTKLEHPDKSAYELGEQTSLVPLVLEGGVGAGRLAAKGAKALSPTNIAASFLKGNLSPEELAANLRATQGTETNLGNVVQNPHLQRYLENTLFKVPFTGAAQTLERAAKQTEQKGQDILSNLLGEHNPINTEKKLNDSLKNEFLKTRSIKKNLYDIPDKLAESVGFRPAIDNFVKTANKHKNILEDTILLKNEPSTRNLLNKLLGYVEPFKKEKQATSILDAQGRPILKEKEIKLPSLKEANLMKGKLNELASKASSSVDLEHQQQAAIFRDLANSLKTDISQSISKFDHPELSEAYRNAENFYGTNYARYLDPDIYKFIRMRNPKDSDQIVSSFIKTGPSNDQANKIEKLAEALPKDKRNLLGYNYLSKALNRNGSLNQNKLVALLGENKLGPRQFEALFPNPALRNSLLDYQRLVNLNKKGISIMFNPATGQQATLNLGKKLANLPFGRVVTNLLTSPDVREKVVKAIIKKKTNQ